MLTIRHTKIFRGPSLWGPVPVILLEVAIGQLEARLRQETPSFFPRLAELVPSLRDFGHLVYQPEGGLQRLLLDRLSLALQQQAAQVAHAAMLGAGGELAYARTYPTAEEGRYRVVYAYAQAEVGVAAGALAVRLLNHLLTNGDPDFDFSSELAKLIRVTKQLAYHRTTAIVVAAAERRGIPVERLEQGRGIVLLGNGCHQRHILLGSITSETGLIAARIATDKGLTSQLLREAGLPVPRNAVVSNADDAAAASKRIGYPVVVKPLDAGQGRGVTVDVRDEAEVREAFPRAKQLSRRGQVIVERFIPGKNYRILVVNGQVVAVAERVPAHVIGDGTHTIAELIEMTNADPRRGGKESMLLRIRVDAQTRKVLARHGLELHDVPEAGRVVPLKPSGSWSTGDTTTDRTDEIHPDNAEIARQAAMVVGLDVAGIDLITPTITHSAYEQGGAINEVNQQPGLHLETYPQEGTGRDVGMAIVDHLFPPGQLVRVPIVAITGTNGKTTTTRMIAHIMKIAGKKVGLTTTDGIYIDGTRVVAGDRAGASSARKVLRNPAIDYAVLETARGGILRSGLGFDRCDVAVVTNVTSDHLGLGGVTTLEELAQVKAVVPRAVHHDGASVLNADNFYTVEMATVAGGEIIFFSMDEANPVVRDHLRERGKAVVLRQTEAGEMLTLLANQAEIEILLAEAIPATMGGRIRVNIANALAAAAAALVQDVPLETIRTALGGFSSSFTQTPGRFNLLEIDGRKVMIDYVHNLHGMEAMADFVKRIGVNRGVAVIRMPGDRRDEDIEAFGRLAAETFDELVIREGKTRGRRPGEVPELLRAGALAGGLAPDNVSIILDERRAVTRAIERGGPGDLVVLMADEGRVSWLWEQVARGTVIDGAE